MLDWRLTSPRNVALNILAARSTSRRDHHSSVPLASFQQDAANRAKTIIDRYGGVLIADSVGLGKTFVALALIEDAIRSDRHVAVIVPASLRTMWRAELKKLGLSGIALLSHTGLAFGRRPPFQPQMIVVDEAHAFRNPRTRRYRALRTICKRAVVILLTASPVNNSLSDLYFELRLFCSDSAFRDIGIGSLRALLLGKESARAGDLDRIRRAVIVRRSRLAIRRAAAQLPGFRFPAEVKLVPVRYELATPVADLRAWLGRLTFPAHRIDASRKFSDAILRFGFLKRFESSMHALRMTLLRQIRFYEEYVSALERGLVLRPRVFHSLYDVSPDSLQLVLEPIALEEAASRTISHDLENAQQELSTLRSWYSAMQEREDTKLQSLLVLLAARREVKTLVFTEYRDTARYLWQFLRRRFAVGLIDGSGAWIGETKAARREVVERFAPVANGARVHAREAISVLITTDVLAEGMNLQDADAVVSYDLPWNPVRLIQRAGRIDRIGSLHDVVSIYNFIPDREFDVFLGLARTLRTKIETVRVAVGLERPVLEPEEVVEALARGDAGVLDRADGDSYDDLLIDAAIPPMDGVPYSVMPASSGAYAWLGLQHGHVWSIVRLDLQTASARESNGAAVLRSAMGCECIPCIPDGRALECVEHYLAQLNQAPAGIDSRGVASRLARMIRQRLSELPMEEASDVYQAADDVLELLSGPIENSVEDELEDLLRRAPTSLGPVLNAVKKAFSDKRKSAAAPAGWRLTGVLIAD